LGGAVKEDVIIMLALVAIMFVGGYSVRRSPRPR
jgi:hypothetical protein